MNDPRKMPKRLLSWLDIERPRGKRTHTPAHVEEATKAARRLNHG